MTAKLSDDLHNCNNLVNGLDRLLAEAAVFLRQAYTSGRALVIALQLERKALSAKRYAQQRSGG